MSEPSAAPAEDCIQLAHGGGGTRMQQLIDQELRGLYDDPELVLHDAAVLEKPDGPLAISTDGYVVQPLEFAGGDIGRLAVVGTCNDLVMAGARPRALSVGLILEEGLPLALLRRVVASMAAAARECGVAIVTGDTKVVERGKADGLFITTSGIGVVAGRSGGLPPLDRSAIHPSAIHPSAIRAGDQVLVSGDLGRHGVAILAARHGLRLEPPVPSDCAPLWPLVHQLLQAGAVPHCLRDLTRGGLASALHELALAAAVEIAIEESQLPVLPAVASTCELLGFEPIHLANEGRCVLVVPPELRRPVEDLLIPHGGAWIGEVRPAAGRARVLLTTALGTERLLLPLSGELLPRIC